MKRNADKITLRCTSRCTEVSSFTLNKILSENKIKD